MLLVIADTSPVRYLVQIGRIDLLAHLFGRVTLPLVVADELRHPSAPAGVRTWMTQPPDWLQVLPAPDLDDPALDTLDPGERSTIALGLSLGADLILIDDRKGAAAALRKGFEVTGTLGILDLVARRGLIELPRALEQLRETNFRYRPEMFAALLKKHGKETIPE